jgi:hypothetical protein
MQLSVVAQIAQVVASIGTLVAVACSIYIANKARQEVREDRRLRTHPVVVMEPGGYVVSVKRTPFNYRIPGKNPSSVERDFKHFPKDGLRIDSEPFGHVRNIGQGPAVEVQLIFIPGRILIGDAELLLDTRKRAQPQYSAHWNVKVAMRHVLESGAESEIAGLPCFITLDFEDKISYAEGIIEITYRDLGARVHCTKQEFRYFNDELDTQRVYLMNFGDILEIP